MHKFVLALGLTLASSVALAQTTGNTAADTVAGEKAPHKARMHNDLGLTDEQVQEMRAIRDAGGSRADMNAVLTPEQQAKAAEQRKAHAADRANRMKDNLDLTDEQVNEIEEIKERRGSREEIRAVLTPEQQAKFDQMRSKKNDKKAAKMAQ